MARKSRTRRFAIASGLIILLLLVVVIALPTLLSWGLARGMIERAAGANLNGTVTIQSLRLRWFGPQDVRGFIVTDQDGQRVAELNLTASPGLLAIVRNRVRDLQIDLDGTLRGTLKEDGSIGLAHLFKETDKSEREPRPAADRPMLSLDGMPPTHLRLAGVNLELTDAASGEDFAARNLVGEWIYQPGGPLVYSLDGTTHARGTEGTLRFVGSAEHLFSSSGRFTPRGATFVLSGELESLPIPGAELPTTLERLEITLHADDLGRKLDVVLRGDASTEGEEASRLTAILYVRELFNSAGAARFAIENVEGMAGGTRLPTRLVQPLLAGTAFNLPRDLGPSADFNIEFTAGDVIEANMFVTGSRASLRMTAAYDAATGGWEGEQFTASATAADPELIEALTGLHVAEATDLILELDRFRLPAVDPETNRRPLTDYALHGRLSFDGPVRLHLAEDRRDEPIAIAAADLRFETDRLADLLVLDGRALIEGADVVLNERITHLFNAEGEFEPAAARPDGTLIVTGLPRDVIAARAAGASELIAEALEDRVDLGLTTAFTDGALGARLLLASGAQRAEFDLLRHEDRIQVRQADASGRISPALVALLQADREAPIELVEAAEITVSLEPFVVGIGTPFALELPREPVRGRIRSVRVSLSKVPGFAETVQLRSTQLDLEAQMSDVAQYRLEGTTALHRHGSGDRAARAAFDLTYSPDESQPELNGDLHLTDIEMTALETLLGREPESFRTWAGSGGAMRISFQQRGETLNANLTTELDRIKGGFDLVLDGERLRLSGETTEMRLSPAATERLLAQTEENRVLTVTHDMPATLRIAEIVLPREVLLDEPFDARAARFDIHLRGSPLRIRTTAGESARLNDLDVTLRSSDPVEQTTFRAQAASELGQVRGSMNVDGTILGLLTSDGAFNTEHAAVDLDATLDSVPSALVDALLRMNGYFAATVGQTMNASLKTRQFSTQTGTVSLEVTSPNGWLNARGTASDGLIHISGADPIRAELEINPLLRQKVLSRIHPLLGDIVKSDSPLAATVSGATFPMTGGVSRLNADINLTVGAVEFDQRTPLFTILSLAQISAGVDLTRDLRGNIAPIEARVRGGVVEYDQFTVRLGTLTMPYSGAINLNTQEVQLRTAVPLGALAANVLPRIARDFSDDKTRQTVQAIEVPIVTRGKIGSLKTEPEIDIAKVVGEIISRQLIPGEIGNILDNIFNPRRRD